MTNKEKYQRAFGVLHASDDFLKEELFMKQTKRFPLRRALCLCAAVILVFGLATVCYAADVGGIRRMVQIWVHGDQTDAVLDIQNGSYTLTYEDAQGNTHDQGGGGVAIEWDGSERPLTEEEIMEHLNTPEPEVEYREDGTIWIYYMDQAMEITDKFDENNCCFVQLRNGTDTLYVTVRKDNGYSWSSTEFAQPEEFNVKRP